MTNQLFLAARARKEKFWSHLMEHVNMIPYQSGCCNTDSLITYWIQLPVFITIYMSFYVAVYLENVNRTVP